MISMAQIGRFESFLALVSLSSFLYFGVGELKYLYGEEEEDQGFRGEREVDGSRQIKQRERERYEMYWNDKPVDKHKYL